MRELIGGAIVGVLALFAIKLGFVLYGLSVPLVSYDLEGSPTTASPGDTVEGVVTVRLKPGVERAHVRVAASCAEQVEVLGVGGEIVGSVPRSASCPDSVSGLQLIRDSTTGAFAPFQWIIPRTLTPGTYILRAKMLAAPDLEAEKPIEIVARR